MVVSRKGTHDRSVERVRFCETRERERTHGEVGEDLPTTNTEAIHLARSLWSAKHRPLGNSTK
eukprot:scaffold450_cov175-Amphora_coffeaeformis.AAC.5